MPLQTPDLARRPPGLAGLLFAIMAAACLALVPAGSALAQSTAAAAFCARDLSATDTRLKATLRRLETTRSSPIAQRCSVFRDHIRVMQQAAVVFERCTTGRHRQENVGQMIGSIADWREIVARNCR
ncbi:hypothetical protein [Phreatobacter sp.]|uniref:hypothetical protein n=1 Tax=Phreatobacter sp. TaxID=1966341 RepID=UPI003F6E9B55